MATKSIITRIKNKVDTYQNWSSSAGKLLDGEIAIVRVPTGETYTNPVTGKSEPVVELLMKVGDGVHTFNEVDEKGNPYLPWLSAKASDVYNWAKKGTIEEVPVTIDGKASTIGAYLAKVNTNASNISTNATGIAANLEAINTLKGSNTTTGSVAKAIKDAIDALDYSTSTTETSTSKISFVTAVTQTNGKIAVKKRDIIEADLPDISASKIKVDSNTKLDAKLSAMDELIAANTDKLTGHTDAAINTLIDNKINALDGGTDSGSAGSGKYVSKVVQTNGKVATTYSSFPAASTSAAGIVKLGADGGAAKHSDYVALEARVDECETDIAALETAIAGGVHFRGTVTAKPTSASVTVNGSSTAITAVAGDVVIWAAEGIEYIYTGSAWEELGDVTRLGELETKINDLDVSDTNAVASTHKFVSQVTQTDGKIAVTYTQPTSSDVLYASSGTDTVKTKIDANAEAIAANTGKLAGITSTVSSTIDSKITTALAGLDHTSSGSGSYVTNVTQADGKVTVTKGNLPTASTSAAGITKLYTSLGTSTDGTVTRKVVNDVNTKAADAQERVAAVEGNYVKFNSTDNKLYVGTAGVDEIIFDCGGAPTV